MRKENAQAVYHFVRDYIQEHGYPPNLLETAQGCSLSVELVDDALDRLEDERKLVRQLGRPRSIRLAA